MKELICVFRGHHLALGLACLLMAIAAQPGNLAQAQQVPLPGVRGDLYESAGGGSRPRVRAV